MNTILLNQFLLDAATQPWDEWWDGTRLIFADWLEMECAKPNEAAVLRGMVCEVADEWKTEGRRIYAFSMTNSVDNALFQINLSESFDRYTWRCLESFYLSPLANWAEQPILRFLGPWLRLGCKAIECKAGYVAHADGGSWHGELSLDRAQRRCRRKVLEMFPEQIPWVLPHLGKAIESKVKELFHDDSPRWVPFERQPELRNPHGYRIQVVPHFDDIR